jgi:predicted DNA-binding transcriptional regulator AlpA
MKKSQEAQPQALPEIGFLRLKQIVPNLVPVSKSTWWQWIKEGRAPRGIKLSPNVTAWKAEDIRGFLSRKAGGQTS